MKREFLYGGTPIYTGTQSEIAGMISRYLWDRDDTCSVRHIVSYIRILRGTGSGMPIVWRGVGIDPRARACKCWIEDRQAVNQFRASVGLDPL